MDHNIGLYLDRMRTRDPQFLEQDSMREMDPDKICNDILIPAIKSVLMKHTTTSHHDLRRIFRTLVRLGYSTQAYTITKTLIDEHLVNEVLPIIIERHVDEFLNVLLAEWREYFIAAQKLTRAMVYLEHRSAHSLNLDPIYRTSFFSFLDLIIKHETIRERLKDSLLRLIRREQNDTNFNGQTIQAICQMLIEIDKRDHSLYPEYFEKPFLQHLQEIYQTESKILLTENNASEYMREVSKRISKESDHALHFCHKSTIPSITKLVEIEFIQQHAETIIHMENSGVIHMIESKNYEDLSFMYELFKRVSDCHLIIVKLVSTYFQKQCQALVDQIGDKNENPIQFINNLFALVDQFEHVLKTSFKNDDTSENELKFNDGHPTCPNQYYVTYIMSIITDLFEKTHDYFDAEQFTVLFKAIVLLNYFHEKDLFKKYFAMFIEKMQMIINRKYEQKAISMYIQNLLDLKDIFDIFLKRSWTGDSICKKEIDFDLQNFINYMPRITEYLSLFIHDGSRKTDIVLDKIALLVEYLRENDIFQHYYEKHLAQRLMLNKSISNDAEEKMILRLKNVFQNQVIYQLKGMIRDVSISKETMNEFLVYQRQESPIGFGIELAINVLTREYWPLPKGHHPCNLPHVISQLYSCYCNFYTNRYEQRRLILEPHWGTADLTMTYITRKTNERKYLLHVSTYQMIILMLFNEKESWSFEEIHRETNINECDLRQTLLSLVTGKTKEKILVKVSKTNQIEVDDEFSVNRMFAPKKSLVKAKAAVMRIENSKELEETQNKISAIRLHEIDAVIVRIMKLWKVMEHDDLIKQVASKLKSQFQLTAKVIDAQIEALVEREYLSCSNQNSGKQYQYTA